MPQVEISIGGRTFEVACQDGEEHFLHAAAKLLDDEAQHISDQVGRMPEARMLLMAGLMLADKTAGLEEKVKSGETRQAQLQGRIDDLETANNRAQTVAATSATESATTADVTAMMDRITARAEAIAEEVERRVS